MSESLDGKFDADQIHDELKGSPSGSKTRELPIKISWGDEEFVFGDPVSSFVKYANDDHIIIMGDSSKTILRSNVSSLAIMQLH